MRFHLSISNLKSPILNIVSRISNGSFGLSYLQFSYEKEIQSFCFECLKSRKKHFFLFLLLGGVNKEYSYNLCLHHLLFIDKNIYFWQSLKNNERNQQRKRFNENQRKIYIYKMKTRINRLGLDQMLSMAVKHRSLYL